MSGQYLLGGQRDAEREMTLTLTAHAPGGEPTRDADGYDVPGYEDKGTTSGKLQAGSQAGGDAPTRHVTIGGVERPVVEGGLHIPISAPVPVASAQRGQGWEYEVAALGAYDDPALLGRRYLVVSAPAKSFATARRLDVVDITEAP